MAVVLAPGTVPAYPVHLTAQRSPDRPSRGLWLIKWILVIPHLLVLAVLWAAYLVLSVVALVGILVSGRYPRTIFDFNVGVLRWSWRVAYYSYGALATDRYPPFTLRDDPSYPARLDVEYPQRLSRGLALVKWWLLVLPHYLVLTLFTGPGAGATAAREGGGTGWVWEGGLIGVLVFFSGVALLFTGRYPQGLYDLLLGLNRWGLRVAGYAGLMTDVYPPFRLDQGGQEEPRDTAYPAQDLRPRSEWTGGRVVGAVAGSLAVLIGLGLAGGGATLLAAGQDGYLTSPSQSVRTTGYAIASEAVLLQGAGLEEAVGQVRVRAEDPGGGETFVGIARAEDAATYLAGVQHSVVTGPLARDVREVRGGPPTTAPEDYDLWEASASGPGRQVAEVPAQPGSWVLVVMAADGSAGLRADVDVGATLPWLTPAGGVLLALGCVLILGGAVTVALAVRAASAQSQR
jgi:hypothetical protein